MSPFILKNAKWRKVLILLGLVVLVNLLLALSLGGNPNIKPLDLQFSYSLEEAYKMISAYSEQERAVYILVELTVDIIYPIIYSLCLSFALFLLFGKMTLAKLPLFLALIELIENACIVTLLVNYPHEHPGLVGFASVFTSLKWILAVTCLLLVIVGGTLRLLKSKSNN